MLTGKGREGIIWLGLAGDLARFGKVWQGFMRIIASGFAAHNCIGVCRVVINAYLCGAIAVTFDSAEPAADRKRKTTQYARKTSQQEIVL